MLVAVACKGLDVSPCFDYADCLTCYRVEKGVICGCQTLPFSPLPTDDCLTLLAALEVDAIVCGKINADIAKQFCARGIDVAAGAEGPASIVAEQYLNRTLSGFDEMCGDEE